MSEYLVDARGLSCPEPVLLARKALKEYPAGGFAVSVSSATARDNVASMLGASGVNPKVEEKDNEWLIKVPAK